MNRRPINFKLARNLLCPLRTLQLLGWVPSPRRRSGLYGPCPVHRSSNPHSISLVVQDDHVHCYVCSVTLDAIGLYAKVLNLPMLEAAYQLCERLQVEIPVLQE